MLCQALVRFELKFNLRCIVHQRMPPKCHVWNGVYGKANMYKGDLGPHSNLPAEMSTRI